MQEFFMDYGLWLLIGLLVVIGVVFLLTGRKASNTIPAEHSSAVGRIETNTVAEEPVAAAPTTIAAEPRPAPASIMPSVALAPTAVTGPASTTADAPDNLLRMKGVGPKLNQLLIELGVTRYEQIANWSDADIAAIDAKLGNFRGRPIRDQWVDQAKYLAAGDNAGFEGKYGKL